MTDKRELALEALEHALADRADNVYEDMVEASRCLVRLRDELIDRLRRGEAGAGARLTRVNAIVSMVTSAEYPLAGVRKARIREACAALRDLPPR